MNKEAVFSLLRSLSVIALTWLVSSGTLTQDQAHVLANAFNQVWPVLLILGTAAYGAWKRSDANLVKTASTVVPGVEVRVDPMAAPAAVVDVANDRADPAARNVKMTNP